MAHPPAVRNYRPLPLGPLVVAIVVGVLFIAFGPLPLQVIGVLGILGAFATPVVRHFRPVERKSTAPREQPRPTVRPGQDATETQREAPRYRSGLSYANQANHGFGQAAYYEAPDAKAIRSSIESWKGHWDANWAIEDALLFGQFLPGDNDLVNVAIRKASRQGVADLAPTLLDESLATRLEGSGIRSVLDLVATANPDWLAKAGKFTADEIESIHQALETYRDPIRDWSKRWETPGKSSDYELHINLSPAEEAYIRGLADWELIDFSLTPLQTAENEPAESASAEGMPPVWNQHLWQVPPKVIDIDAAPEARERFALNIETQEARRA